MNRNVSIIIKTFERPESLTRLLDSIRNFAPGYRVIIADDSEVVDTRKIHRRFPDLLITYLRLPFDSGISRGRNELLDHVDTEYFLLCDDDFCFDTRTKIDVALELLKREEVDVLGGVFYNFWPVARSFDWLARQVQIWCSSGRPSNFIGELSVHDGVLTVETRTKDFPEYARVDFCHNFFIAKTSPVRDMGGWIDDFKIQEHIAFFLKAKLHGLKVGCSARFGVRHYPVRGDAYLRFRNRSSTSELFQHFNLHTSVRRADNGEVLVERLTPEGKLESHRRSTIRATRRELVRKWSGL